MSKICRDFYKFVLGLSIVLVTETIAFGAQAPNPRVAVPTGRDGRAIQNTSQKRDVSSVRSMARRITTNDARGGSVIANTGRAALNIVPATNARVDKGVRHSASISRSAAPVARAVARVAVNTPVKSARSAVDKNVRHVGLGRAATTRATALFDDVSKIGGGYSQCRDSYATCMDQFCGKANETYRRCFCSSRFNDFRNTEEALDQAKVLLQSFEDNNLNAVDKTAAEVDAMYSATVGEAAIKRDTSGAQSILNEIGDLLSGKIKKASSSGNTSTTSLGVMSLDFSTDLGDIWGGGDAFSDSGASSIFSSNGSQDISGLEGEALYKAVDKQCQAMVSNSCESAAAFNMSKSSYSILISQDCNMYEKSLNTKREQVKETVRQAEKILRQARLEEYRAHNSQDVNECLDRVRSAMLQDSACGAKYERCLDYTGAYINQQTGEPIYSQRLFQLTELIKLGGTDGNGDIFSGNDDFVSFIEGRKMFAKQALDTCRDIADVVWTEFKRTALIEIAQAQDEKIEEVKGTCVQTMRECYDTQTESLKTVDTTKSQVTGAMQAYAAKAMCEDKVIACASLYGDNSNCKFDGNGRLVDENGNASSGHCGLTELLAFVDTVDDVRVAEGCAEALNNYVQTMCAPNSGESDKKFPWGCRKRSVSDIQSDIVEFASRNCAQEGDITGANIAEKLNKFTPEVKDTINRTVNSIKDQISTMFWEMCDAVGTTEGTAEGTAKETVLFEQSGLALDQESNPEISVSAAWLTSVFGSETELKQLADTGVKGYKLILEKTGDNITIAATNGDSRSLGYGVCTIPSPRQLCIQQSQLFNAADNGTWYDSAKRTCNLGVEWYEFRCRMLDGYYVAAEKKCYIK